MKKRICLCIAASAMALIFCLTSWAYWKDELKVKANVAFVYEAQIEVKEETVQKSEQRDNIKPDQRDLVIRPEKSKEITQEPEKSLGEDKSENITESK
ncbi:hypothetical protein LSA36186_09990 [Lachnoanaerobaculum sp. JCM 36186]|uniref:hypothetical protein n=1 Tax=Lachnoanaerobaculum sanguinis TaxID=3065809 RepID=UPI002770B891|nr:hypothetical protein [Lachnoanaerobaculum sp. JCM 36186]GMO02750.1 hypothetical protein LSA36186_09990 [Lachnoanaerobaculum sp. JCM 36186]